MKNNGRKSIAISADAIAGGTIVAVGIILLAIATQAGWAGQSALAAPPTPAPPTPAAEAPPVTPAPSIVVGGGTTLRSVHINLPRSDTTFPGGAEADAINNDCLICHSAGMVLDQASLSRATWQGEVDKMRNDFKAPFAAGDAPAIVDYLANIRSVMSQSAGRQPDAKHGAVIVAQGTTAGAPPCAQCHAFNGVSDASGAFPRLAGQSAYYLATQLRDFASGVRASAIMSPIAKALSPDDVADVAAYFASVNAPLLPLKAPDAALVKRGGELAKAGSAERQIPICDNCHGPGGAGEPPVIPYLAGQYAHYVAFTLHMWQIGFRKNSPDAMGVIAKKLDDQEIAAVAAYYQQVNSPLKAAAK
jgi:cytochrome c553